MTIDETRVTIAVGQCETLSLLPAVAARFFNQLGRMELTPSSLAELIESDPALTVLVLQLCRNKRITTGQAGCGVLGRDKSGSGFDISTGLPSAALGTGSAGKLTTSWIQRILEVLSLREIRDAVLSAKICGGLSEDASTDFRRELTRHSLAAACCAEQLARLASAPLDGPTAYLAGLLHDIGKFLLDEAMPKSFDVLLEQARSQRTSFCKVEQENLGIDHTILGKRFAQRMQLPSDVILGIWLHHSQTGAISQAMPQARIAAVVELADCIVRQARLGESGSYNEDVATEALAGSLGLSPEQIRRVEQQLPELVRRKSEVAGLALLKPGWAYFDALRATAGQLAGESAKLFEESARLQGSASHFDFIRELLPKINSNSAPVELAEDFAVAWQRFYQTGPVCVYLVADSTPDNDIRGQASSPQGKPGAKAVEAVVVDPGAPGQTKAKQIVLDVPADATLIPQPVCDKFAVLDAADYADWLLEQVDTEFDLPHTKLAPLQAAGRTVGIIIFELRHPAAGDISGRFEPVARFGGAVIEMLQTIGSQQWYAERFAQLFSYGVLRKESQGLTDSGPGFAEGLRRGEQRTDVEALVEMAAGAAHEMNNPLSVIQGRAQLLAKSETDPDKKRILEQIQQNAGELSAIIDDLMSYANPEKPRPTETAVRQIIDDAVDLACQKKGVNQLDIKIDAPPDAPNVLVDSAQVASALANIICNGLESYDEQTGPLTIQVSSDKSKPSVAIEVIDSGCGMDEQTLARATQPFFSNRPAGRKRGMGLAHAQRLIEINHGSLELTSQPGKGTAVTVTLPCK